LGVDHSTHAGDGEFPVRVPAKHAEILLEINNAIVSKLDLAEVLNAISGCLKREIRHDFAAIALYDAELDELRLHALDFPADQNFMEKGHVIPLAGTPAAVAFATRKPVLRHHVDFVEFHHPIMQRAAAAGIQSGCAVPLICHDKIVGSMMLASLRESAFTEDDVELLTQIGTQAAIAVENAQNFRKAREAQRQVAEERDRSKLLLEINNAVVSHLDLRTLVQSISASLHRVVPHDAAFITLLDPSGEQLRVEALDVHTVSDGPPFEAGILVPVNDTPEGEAIRTGKPVLIAHQSELGRYSQSTRDQVAAYGIKCGCAVPLLVHGHVLGALSMVSLKAGAFSQENAKLLEQCAAQIAIAVENALNFGKAQQAEKEVREERDRTQLLLEINNALVSRLDLHELVRVISSSVKQVIPHDSFSLALYNEKKGTMYARALESNADPAIDGFEYDHRGTVSGRTFETGMPFYLPRPDPVQFPSPISKAFFDAGMKSLYCVPVSVHGRRLGVLTFASNREDAWGKAEQDLFQEITKQVAIAADNAQNFEAARLAEQAATRERDRSQLLLEINNALVAHLDLRELVRAISISLKHVIPHDFVGLAIHDPESGSFFAQAADSDLKPMSDNIFYDPEGTVGGLSFKTRQPVYVPRPEPERFSSPVTQKFYERGLKSLFAVPLDVHGRILGVMSISAAREDAFGKGDRELFQSIAHQVSIAAANALAVRDLEALKDKLAQEKLYLEDEIRTELNFDEIVGQGPALRGVLRLVDTVAASDSTVLLLGETGTGKELIARAVHDHSRRKGRTFVKLNCAAIPTGLLESELFGHEKGAFTGAIAQKTGRLELADQGTLFLDEVGDVPVEIQPKLLRALQEREFERLGSVHTKRVNVRLVAATNRDLEKMIEERQFRSDLYYRLNVFPIRIPPLRERREDIPLLIRYFAEKFARQMQKPIDSIPTSTMAQLQAWHWPGNVRELENLIERSVILTTGPALQVPLSDMKIAATVPVAAVAAVSTTLESSDRELIIKVLRETRGILAGPNGAASKLGLKRTTLQYKMKKLGITREHWWPSN
jgi:formate hydrogenlyase transcriptional activator